MGCLSRGTASVVRDDHERMETIYIAIELLPRILLTIIKIAVEIYVLNAFSACRSVALLSLSICVGPCWCGGMIPVVMGIRER